MVLDKNKRQEKIEKFDSWMSEKVRNKYYSDHERMMLAYERIE